MYSETVFAFDETVNVIKAEHILLNAGLQVKVMPLPSGMKAGCWMCLRLPPEEAENAKEILEKKSVPPSQVFTRIIKGGNGK